MESWKPLCVDMALWVLLVGDRKNDCIKREFKVMVYSTHFGVSGWIRYVMPLGHCRDVLV